MLNHLKKVWKGEEKLWKVFWLWGVGGIYILSWIGSITKPLRDSYHQLYPFVGISDYSVILTLYAVLLLIFIYKNRGNSFVWKGKTPLHEIILLWGLGGNLPFLMYFLWRAKIIKSDWIHNHFFKMEIFGALYAIVIMILLIKNFNNTSQWLSSFQFLEKIVASVLVLFLGIGAFVSGGLGYSVIFIVAHVLPEFKAFIVSLI